MHRIADRTVRTAGIHANRAADRGGNSRHLGQASQPAANGVVQGLGQIGAGTDPHRLGRAAGVVAKLSEAGGVELEDDPVDAFVGDQEIRTRAEHPHRDVLPPGPANE